MSQEVLGNWSVDCGAQKRMRAVVVAAVALTCLAAACRAAADLYETLGVPRDASQADVRRAYRKMSVTKHPDKGGDQNEWVGISRAYEVLSDAEKRRVYDQFGEEGLSNEAQHGGGGGGFNPFDIFGGFGGFHFDQRGGGPAQQERMPDVEVPLGATLEDLYTGRTYKVAQSRRVLCHKCRGTGAAKAEDVKKCSACGGSGVRLKTVQRGPGFIQQVQTTCDACGGKGKVVSSKCPHCGGAKVEAGKDTLTVVLEQGMADGSEVVFPQQGDERPEAVPGDVKFVVREVPHPRFRREGHDLRTTASVSLLDALVGFDRHIQHLDGHNVSIGRSGVTRPGLVLKIDGEGMPHHGTPSVHGDLFVEFSVAFPETLTDAQKAQFKKILS